MESVHFWTHFQMWKKVEILPYHTLGIYKWEALWHSLLLSDIRIPDENDLKRANQILLG